MRKDKRLRQTSFSDVCGTMDELKRLIDEQEPAEVFGRGGAAASLVGDAEFMLRKMEDRLSEYREFAGEIEKTAAALRAVEPAGIEEGLESLEKLSRLTSSKPGKPQPAREEIFELAEQAREAATRQEHRLREFKDLALKINGLFTSVRGGRPWLAADDRAESYREQLIKKYQAWLPPEPHRGRLLDRICGGKNVTIDFAKTGEEPSVNFEDGGFIKMSRVRYDEDIQNFHPAGFKPGKSGRRYRRSDPGAPPLNTENPDRGK